MGLELVKAGADEENVIILLWPGRDWEPTLSVDSPSEGV